ncbi:plasma-membrane proton-efflux P-type ATPase [Pilobolus umbonatus]|nr:plasma-membrane proton-efflux P-type ATPase [Pilobolus umbonatus]
MGFKRLKEESVPLTPLNNSPSTLSNEVPSHLEPYIQTKPSWGLSHDQVQERRERFGRNELKEKPRNKILHFLSFFTGPISYLMILSVILTAITQDWLDFGIILGMLILNALIGYIEENKAESSIQALKTSLALHTRCWRNGELIEMEASDLVVGDVIVLRLGDIVPADCRLLGLGAMGESTDDVLQVDQSSLTGESLTSKKRTGHIVFSSSIIRQGQQQAVVIRTGPDTFIGKTANLISITAASSGRFQQVINSIGNFLIIISVVLVLILFAYNLIEQRVLFGFVTGEHVLSALNEMVVLTIAAIPVGLPTVMSITMAIGAKQLAKKQVIVKRLTAVEEFASVSILCSDKTGTLTDNSLTFDEPYVTHAFSQEDLLMYAYLSSSKASTDDPIESAIRSAAEKKHPLIVSKEDVQGYKLVSFKPFNSIDKLAEATVENTTTMKTFRVAKGAPNVILSMTASEHEEHVVESFAKRGIRCLGVAIQQSEKWVFVGFLSFLDPPRADSAQTLAECQQLGISVKMLTGDQKTISKEVAVRLGMGSHILDANELLDNTKTEDELADLCLHSDGFASVVPEHKFRVVELLQGKDYFVAMTGDGVNDAPALKKANVGIAVAGSTDAARSAADIVLLAPGLSAIIDGIKISRVIFQRLQSYALYRVTSTIHFLIFFFVITLAEDWKMPSVFLILISLLNDAATLIMAVDNVQVSPTPNMWRVTLLIVLSCVLASVLACFSFAHFYIFRDVILVKPSELTTIMYLHISSAPHFVIFSTRSNTFWWKSLPSLPFTVVILSTQLVALILSVYGVVGGEAQNISGIGWINGLIVVSLSVVIFFITDFVKVGTIFLWDLKFNKTSTQPTKASQFIKKQQRSRSGYDRAERRDSFSSVKSY